MHLDGQTVAVHRVMWVCKHGYLPGKKQLDHKRHEGCISKLCVNDEHLEPVTNSKNQRRRKEHLQRVAEIDQNNEAVINLGEISDEEAAILDAFTSSYGT